MKTKIFQIGFNKTGTRAIAHFFQMNDFRVAHWENGDIAFAIQNDLKTNRKPLTDWKDFDAFFDMEYVSKDLIVQGIYQFRELHAAYPDALFILNDRPTQKMCNSRLAHDNGTYLANTMSALNLTSEQEVVQYWDESKALHHAAVIDYFATQPNAKLFIWDIENPDFQQLQALLKEPLNTAHWQVVGKTI